MSRPPKARESVIDAFESIINGEGERAATMDATARSAGVSKGGLLYHFASKEALETAMVDRMVERAAEDVDEILRSPDGAVAAFMRTSVMHDTPLDRSIIAVSRLAQNGHAAAGDALRRVRELWEEAMRPHTRDAATLQLVMLVSDGLYFNNALTAGSVPGPALDDAALNDLIALVERTVGPRVPAPAPAKA